MKPFIPIIIDGPARRKKITVQRRTFEVYKQPKLSAIDHIRADPYSSLPALDQVLYHVHLFRVGEVTFAIASVNPAPPPLEKALKLIFTASARQAVV
jgi:hypothetical protein